MVFSLYAVGDRIIGNVLLDGDSSSTVTLPAGCQLDVELRDPSIHDTPARVLGSAQYSSIFTFPILYSLTYTPDVHPKPFYSMFAKITCPSGILYMSDSGRHITVEEDGISSVNIFVRAVR